MGQCVVERHILGIVAFQPGPLFLHLLQQVGHGALGAGGESGARRGGNCAVAVVVVESQRGDIIFHLRIGIEIVALLAAQQGRTVYVVEQLVRFCYPTTALQQAYLHQLGYQLLHLDVRTLFYQMMSGRPCDRQHAVDIGFGSVVLCQHVVAKRQVVVCA